MWAKVGQGSVQVCLPEGHSEVKEGSVRLGDRFYNLHKKQWEDVKEHEVGVPFAVPFSVLVRKDEPQEVKSDAHEVVAGTPCEVGKGTSV